MGKIFPVSQEAVIRGQKITVSTGSVTPEAAEFVVVSPEAVAQKFGWKYDFIRVLQNYRPVILPQLLINAFIVHVNFKFPITRLIGS